MKDAAEKVQKLMGEPRNYGPTSDELEEMNRVAEEARLKKETEERANASDIIEEVRRKILKKLMKFKILECVNIGTERRKHAVQYVLKKMDARSLKQKRSKIKKKMVKNILKVYLKELLEL